MRFFKIYLAVVLWATVSISCSINKVTGPDLSGHWYVFDIHAGYLEFSINTSGDSIYICKPYYGKVGHEHMVVSEGNFIQYHEGTINDVRISGKIVELNKDTLHLKYDVTDEYCVRLNEIPEIIDPETGCFIDSEKRSDSLSNN